VLNVAGGEVDAGNIVVGSSGSGTLSITDGGVVRANQIQRAQNLSGGSYRVFMDGGTIIAKQNVDSWYLASLDGVTLGENGGVIDTDGHNLKIMACYGFDGIGSFTKRGEGTLTINYSDFGINFNYKAHGKIIVERGTLKLPSNQTIYCEGVEVADGATLDRSGSEIIIVNKEIARARWTNATGDGNVANPLNWNVTLRYYNQDVSFEEAVEGLVPAADTPITVPYAPGVPAFDNFTDVTWVVEEDTCSEGYSRPADILSKAAAWYDPSDSSTLTKNDDNRVTGIANKIPGGSLIDLQTHKAENASGLSTDGFNGRPSILFDHSSGYRSKDHFPSDFPANGERTLFVVAKGDTSKMTMLSVAQNSGEEGRSWLLAHGTDWGRSYQVSHSEDGGASWQQLKVSFGNIENKKAYVFSGRTQLKEDTGDARIITSAALDSQGNKIGNTDDSHLMPMGSGNLNLYTYYGLFESGGYKADSDGYQGEALIFTNALSNAEMDAVNAYLKEKWLDPLVVMPDFDSLVVNAQVDLGGATRTFEKLSGSGSFVDGTVVLTGELEVTVNPDGSVVAPSFDTLVLGEDARLVVKGAKNLPQGELVTVLPFTTLEGMFASVVSDKGHVVLRYLENRVDARRDAGFCIRVR